MSLMDNQSLETFVFEDEDYCYGDDWKMEGVGFGFEFEVEVEMEFETQIWINVVVVVVVGILLVSSVHKDFEYIQYFDIHYNQERKKDLMILLNSYELEYLHYCLQCLLVQVNGDQ